MGSEMCIRDSWLVVRAFAASLGEGGRSVRKKKLKRTWVRSTYRKERKVWGGSRVVMAVAPAIVGGGEGVYEMQQSGSSGGGVYDDQSRRTATERNGKNRCSGFSGEDNVVEGGLCRSKGITKPCQKDCRDREKWEPKRIRLGTAHRRRKLAMNCSF